MCPVADVMAYLANPLRCFIGEGGGTLMDFFADLGAPVPSPISQAMRDAIFPLAVDAIWAFSPLGSLEKVRTRALKLVYCLMVHP